MRSTPRTGDVRRVGAPLLLAFAVMMAHQVASRATRDALFLSHYPPTALPGMVIAASVLSIVGAISVARVLSRFGPMRVVPATFALSSLLSLGEWLLAMRRPEVASVVVYLHVASVGPVLASGFWSILNERFDPRAAKRLIGRITAIGTLGGVAGGLLAERSASWLGVAGTLAVLALMQGWCAWSLRRLAGDAGRQASAAPGAGGGTAVPAIRRIVGTPYLRNLALLLLGSSISAALLDYVFKAQSAGAMHAGVGLLRLFAAFYTGTALFTFAIQALLTRLTLERVGLARSLGVLPGAVVVGGVVTALVPGPWSVGFARGLEAVLRGSLFRSGYELLYLPIPPAEKRATKPIVDIGSDRLGDMIGAGLVAVVLTLPSGATATLMGIAVAVAIATLTLVTRLQSGYVASLEAGLRAGAVELDSIEIPDWSMGRRLEQRLALAAASPADDALDVEIGKPPEASPHEEIVPMPDDDETRALKALRSGSRTRVRALLAGPAPLDPLLVPATIALLAWDEVALNAIQALRGVVSSHVGQLVDALLDSESDFSVRRRIPAVLAASRTGRAVEGLVHGLADIRFEVRYRCGRALLNVLSNEPSLTVFPETVFEAVRRETRVGRTVWSSQRLLEQLDEESPESFVDAFVRERASRSLEHVFTLLALVLPREPLRIAFSGLHAGDAALRGIALEYLESVLPPSVREGLWPHLEVEQSSRRDVGAPARNRAEVLDELLRSHQSILLDVQQLRRDQGEGNEMASS